MTPQEKMTSIQKAGTLIGILLIVLVVLAFFSMLYIPSVLIVPGDATATANHVMASEGLFRLGMVSDALVFLIEIVLTGLLYVIIQPVSKTWALIATLARLAMTILQGMNVLNYFFILLLLGGGEYLSVFTPEQRHALALFFFNAHDSVVLIWGLFFGLHLCVFGYLVYQSGYIPRVIGVLLMLTAVYYGVQDFGTMLWPQYKTAIASLGFLSILEIAFPIWLLVKGINVDAWQKSGRYLPQ